MEKYKGKFFGTSKIKSVEETEEKTHRGDDVLRLIFEDDKEQLIPSKVAEYAITDKETDLTSLRDILVEPVAKEVIEIFLDSHLKVEDFEYVLTKVRLSVQNSITKATDKLWKKDGNSITLVDVNDVLNND